MPSRPRFHVRETEGSVNHVVDSILLTSCIDFMVHLRAGSDHLPADLCVTRSRTLPDLMVTMYDAVSGSENLPVSA